MLITSSGKMEEKNTFQLWLKSMGWHKRGGLKSAAEALDKHRKTIERYNEGAKLSIETRLAMTAIAQELKPWDPKSEGLPAVHVSFSIGRDTPNERNTNN